MKKYWKILILIQIIIVTILGAVYLKKKDQNPICKNCNVLLISLDTLSAKHLPCYGYERDTSPNLCKFAQDNVYFTKSYSQSYWTRPSQTSVITGLEPTSHRVLTPYEDKLNNSIKTLPEIFKENGYKTYYFGPKKDELSWDTSVWNKGFDEDWSNKYTDDISHWNNIFNIINNKKKPIFAYLHTYYIHDQELPDFRNNKKKVSKEENFINEDFKQYIESSFRERLSSSLTIDSKKYTTDLYKKISYIKTMDDFREFLKELPDNEKESLITSYSYKNIKKSNLNLKMTDDYDQRIEELDLNLDIFFKKIEELSKKDTIIIIYADHGQTLGERGSFGHCSDFPDCLYNETINVPLILKIPGVKKGEIKELAQGIDIYPTVLSLVGLTSPEYVEGEDLSNVIFKNEKSKKKYVVSESGYEQKVIIDNKWKLYVKDAWNNVPENYELFDLENDRYELTNVASKYPEIVKEKLNQFVEYMKGRSKSANQENKGEFPEWMDEIKKEKIRKEGYF